MKIAKHNFGIRPICTIPKCKNDCQFMGTYSAAGNPRFRKYCTQCHIERQANKKGQTTTEWINAMHPYRKHRKEYCENRDGRLGYKCNYKIRFSGQLQVDHINGKPIDDRPKNLQTLCANCHIFKTFNKGDNKSHGRKYFTQLLKAA